MLETVNPLELVKLGMLMGVTSGSPETIVGLIDGPVVINHPDLADVDIHQILRIPGTCAQAGSAACLHGTFVAGILCSKRGSIAPAICPSCTLLVRPIFAETSSADGQLPNASPEELADAVADCIEAGVHVINLSAALAQPSPNAHRQLENALNYAA